MSRQAKLVFDSARVGALPGFRSVAAAERSLLFRADGICVDILVLPPSGGLQVAHGQVIEEAGERGVPGATVRLGDEAVPTETDAFGQFSVSALRGDGAQTLHVGSGPLALVCAVPSEGGAR